MWSITIRMDEETTCPEIEITHDILQWIQQLEDNYEKQKAAVLEEVMKRLIVSEKTT
jgi:hypothetical protein